MLNFIQFFCRSCRPAPSTLALCVVLTLSSSLPLSAAPPAQKQLVHPADRIVCTQPLGALYTPRRTTFRVWAPTARRLTLRLYAAPLGGTPRDIALEQHASDGSWETTVEGDCRNMYYTYRADVAGGDPRRELLDPYAHAVTGPDGRAIVVHDETPVADRPSFPLQDAVVYELHVRDFTVDPDSGIQRRGQYLGFTESGTRLHGHPDLPTGLDHLTALGVNTVQVMPVTEFRGDEAAQRYNWGYDPVVFQSPDGMYTSERLDASRVTELKRMIDALHRRGVRVILDIVLNHTVEDIGHRVYSFEGLVPGYFYRRRLDGTYWNGSGCGNEVRSEAPMARRFIKDTLKHWVTEYKVDGFRLDLMGLIDLETMRQATAELHAIDPRIFVWGEPWAAGDTPITRTEKGAQRGLGFSVFNDDFRDALKGSVFDPRDRGFVQDGSRLDRVKQGVAGSLDTFAASPLESLNYVECHDNLTLWDKLAASMPRSPLPTRRAMDRLSAAILFTSFGVPFIQSGQELLRTKGGDDNSYDKPDAVNMIRWDARFTQRDTFEYYRGLIAIRQAHPLFRPASAEAARKSLRFVEGLPDKTLGWIVDDRGGHDTWTRALVVVNGSDVAQRLPLPPGRWKVFADGEVASAAGLPREAPAALPPHSALILGEPR